MSLNAQQLKKIQEYFSNKPVLKAYLFGSQLKKTTPKNSDIDLLVELDYKQKIGLLFIQMRLDLENLLGKKVDLVSNNGISKHIKPFVDKEKQMIYAK